MPSVPEHLQEAHVNESFARDLGLTTDVSRRWSYTVYYYAAVHLARAFVRKQKPNVIIDSHLGFDTEFRNAGASDEDYKRYRRMKDGSEKARYDCQTVSETSLADMLGDAYRPFKESLLASLRVTPW
jgi:hypothetical protein